MAIYLSNRQKTLAVKEANVHQGLDKLMNELGLFEAELSVSIVGDEEIREINRNYRGVDASTNVIAFALDEGEPMLGAPRVLGDIVISMDTIVKEAPLLGYTDGEMFYFYLVHGLLHLLGFDHELGEEEAAKQEAETERLWNMINHSL